ncbi:uncharacterized protein [Parasteatoda tepidariorum]|uniref:uncharacterized protein n=1 Tax=Parasteatoda tepidariorum TaxID=114398 RepID=UPI00077FD93A|nr:uncharacterized protein LOC107440754 [Parasteatoda tepidariorum]
MRVDQYIRMEGENNNPQRDLVLRIEERINQVDQQELDNFNPFDEGSTDFIIHFASLFANFYDNYHHFARDDLNELDNRIPDLRQSSERLTESFAKWFAKRKELIGVLDSSACELDRRFTIVTTSRLIGSILDLVYNIDSIFDNKISHMITIQAFGVSRALGVASLIFFKCLPHFAYMGLVAAFADISYDKITMREILKANEEDTKLFAKIEKWIQETEDLEFSIKQIFPNGFRLDVNIAKKVEKVLSNYQEDTKIFTTAVLSSIQSNPKLRGNVTQLCKIFKFSKTEAAKEWYDRSLRGVHSVGMEVTKLEYRNQLIQLSLAAPEIPLEVIKLAPEIEVRLKDSDSKVDARNIIKVKLKFIPHLFLGAVNCFYIYSSYKELVDGVKHQHSDLLRDMAKKADIHMRKMHIFMNRCKGSKQLTDATVK